MKPKTRYTKSGRLNIAYQSFGSGSVDLVYIPGWVSNIDLMWACPELVYFFAELGKITRVILFDKRGTGLSDRITELSTLEERMDDIRAVMDAVGCKKAVLFGHSEGGSASALFAATYPNRVISLITFGIFAKRRYAPDYPWAPSDEERQKLYDMIENNWGSAEKDLATLAPSMAKNTVFMEWLANYFRSGASPSAALVLTKMNTEVNIINILGSIKVPALILQRTNDIDVKIEEGRFIADRIPKAKFVELDGDDHLFWIGNTSQVLKNIHEFITKESVPRHYEQQLYTIGAVNIISEQRPSENELAQLSDYVNHHRGTIILKEESFFVAIFEGPSRAVNCGLGLIDTAQRFGAEIVISVHIKESTVNESHFINTGTEKLIEKILHEALPNQILVTQTVKHLLSGVGLSFNKHSEVLLDPARNEAVSLFAVTDELSLKNEMINATTITVPSNDSFLEDVLNIIDDHLEDYYLSVELLCKQIGMSERQLQRKLKATTNKSPNQLISSVRLHRAKELLLQSEHKVAEIAYQTGFSNPSYFSKSFKREFGLTPSSLQQKRYH